MGLFLPESHVYIKGYCMCMYVLGRTEVIHQDDEPPKNASRTSDSGVRI